jgi:hypothetical protein
VVNQDTVEVNKELEVKVFSEHRRGSVVLAQKDMSEKDKVTVGKMSYLDVVRGSQSSLTEKQTLEFLESHKFMNYPKTLNVLEPVSKSEAEKRKRNSEGKTGDKGKKNKIDNDGVVWGKEKRWRIITNEICNDKRQGIGEGEVEGGE